MSALARLARGLRWRCEIWAKPKKVLIIMCSQPGDSRAYDSTAFELGPPGGAFIKLARPPNHILTALLTIASVQPAILLLQSTAV